MIEYRKNGPLLITILIMMGLIGVLLFLMLSRTEGKLTFPLDDPYIHWAIGRSIFVSGNWGPSPFQFQLSSSSPLFTLLTGLGGLLTSKPWIFTTLLNLIAGISWLYVMSRSSMIRQQSPFLQTLLLLMPAIMLPWHLLVLLGMEHMFHTLFACLFLFLNASPNRSHLFWLLLVSMIMMGFRYESLFIFASFLLVNVRKRKTWLIVMVALIPFWGIGGWSMIQGGTFLPISVLGKGYSPDWGIMSFLAWSARWIQVLYENPFMGSLLILLMLVIVFEKEKAIRQAAWITLLTSIAHLQFAEVGGYRYEAYVFGMGFWVWVNSDIWRDFWAYAFEKRRPLLFLVLGVVLLPVGIRSSFFTVQFPLFSQNIYQQSYLSGQFLEEYYPQSSVALNDIGAGSYLANIQLTDMVGIGDQVVHDIRVDGRYTSEVMDSLTNARAVKIAVVHDIWVGPVLPSNWIKVADWTIPNNMICADETLSFYGINRREASLLRENLQAFSSRIPESVDLKFLGK